MSVSKFKHVFDVFFLFSRHRRRGFTWTPVAFHRTLSPVGVCSSQPAAFLRRHVGERKPKQPNLISQGSVELCSAPFPPRPHVLTALCTTSVTFSPCFSPFIISSLNPDRERSCVRLTTGTHCSPLPLPNPTPPFLLNAPKYVFQHDFSFRHFFSDLLFF